MDWENIKTKYPRSANALFWYCTEHKITDIYKLDFRFATATIQIFFSRSLIYVMPYINKDKWEVRINSKYMEASFSNLLNAYEYGFEVAFGLLESRMSGKSNEKVTVHQLFNLLFDILPEKQQKNFNHFSSITRSLRLNKIKTQIFIEGLDWEKAGDVYFLPTGIDKVKQYFLKL